jgi:hypothetical protein
MASIKQNPQSRSPIHSTKLLTFDSWLWAPEAEELELKLVLNLKWRSKALGVKRDWVRPSEHLPLVRLFLLILLPFHCRC